jgi:glycosyltransferase involved in cell wall biosynthesis
MDHPAQQFASGLRELALYGDIELHVFYRSVSKRFHDRGFDREISWDVDLLDGYHAHYPSTGASAISSARWFRKEVRSIKPDVIICYGWASRIARLALLQGLTSRVPILLYGDSTWQHSSRGRHRLIRPVVLRALLRACAGAVSTGAFNREFYILHGMRPDRIFAGVCPADVDTFGAARKAGRAADEYSRAPLRIGFAGKLIPRKGADVLIEASALLPKEIPWSATIVGDGPLASDLKALAIRLGVGDRVFFSGFANTTEMPKILAEFDVLVVPSRLDMRVLITIEAIAAGAVVVVSSATAVWGQGDLIQDGVTGLVYASGDPVDLSRHLRLLMEDRDLLATIRENGCRRVTEFGPEAFAKSMAAAARDVVSEHRSRG